jgi:hypothetical protein
LQKVYTGLNRFGSDAEEVEALVCKTSLSGFESRRYLHSLIQKNKPAPFRVPNDTCNLHCGAVREVNARVSPD